MSDVPKKRIGQITEQISLQRLIEAKGVTLEEAADGHIGRCPFHADAGKALKVDIKANRWDCLAGCQKDGTVIDWVMKTEGVSFKHAAEILETDAALTGEVSEATRTTVTKLPLVFSPDDDASMLLGGVTTYYHRTLQQSREALDYLERRGLVHPDLINHFQLGYANRTLGYRIPKKNRKEGNAVRSQLQTLGIIRSSGHEHLAGCLVVPCLNSNGKPIQLYGRKILGKRLRAGTEQHLWLKERPPEMWNLNGIAGQPEAIVCHSVIDGLTFWCAGIRNVVSFPHESVRQYFEMLSELGVDRVILADSLYAHDNNHSELALAEWRNSGFGVFRIVFPVGVDANEYFVKMPSADRAFEQLIRKAEWLGNGRAPPLYSVSSELPEEDATADSVYEEHQWKVDPVLQSSNAVPLPAAAMPPAPADMDVDVTENEIAMTFGDRRYRVRGLDRNLSIDVLRVNVLVSRENAFHVDTLDLYGARSRATFTHQASLEIGVHEDTIKRDLGRILLKLETLQDGQIRHALAPNGGEINGKERQAALELLEAPNLIDQIIADFETCGIVGERDNVLMGYLACVSRKLSRPLALIIQSASAAGKSSLLDSILSLMPEGDRVHYSAVTGQSLYYLGELDLRHKILAIAEEKGASQAAYALKLLQSDGVLSIASTGKDVSSGRLVTHEYRVDGPVMLAMTTTRIDMDEELLNRCIIMSVDEGREQTRAILAAQRHRRTLKGLESAQAKEEVIARHRTAQRLLRPLAVVNPFADQLTFLDDRTRSRRDHEKYLSIIDAIALLHQFQRPIKTLTRGEKLIEYVEVMLDDIALANSLAHQILGRSVDELPPQTRALLGHLQRLALEVADRRHVPLTEVRFTRRLVREWLGWGDTQLKVHLSRLVDFEYLLAHRMARTRPIEYELIFDGPTDGDPHMNGLIDVNSLRQNSGRTEVGARSASSRVSGSGMEPSLRKEKTSDSLVSPARHITGQGEPAASHHSDNPGGR